MIVIDWFAWWYTTAWRQVGRRLHMRLAGIFDMFSVKLLAGSLFAPFRQIDAGSVRGPMDVRLRAWFDRSFSRVFGFFLRSLMIITSLIAVIIVGTAGVLWLLIWPLLPALPILGIVAAGSRWTLL